MIDAARFIAQSSDRDAWLAARSRGVTATAVAEAATPSGFDSVVRSWSEPDFLGNEYTAFGTWAEPQLMEFAHRQHGILPNNWLIASEEDPRWLGTPDGLSLTHDLIAEAKTGGTIPKSVKRQHRDQCLWNMFVSDTTRCLYLFQPRAVASDGSFYLGLIEPVTFWVERDETRIKELVEVAERLFAAREEREAA